MQCTKLTTVDISAAVGSPTHITSAKVVQDQPAAFCDVLGYVDPAVQFEVHLPLDKWTQRFLQNGCGGLCGTLGIHGMGDEEGCLPAKNGELAVAATDMGHSGGMDGSFGVKDYQLRVDFAYRGVHVTTLAAKAIIEKYYGQQPKYSYFSGCSDGGREALMEAQRFPEDFNGITAGAPAMNFTTQNSFYHGWNSVTNQDANGNSILGADKLPLLHKAVLAACDALDGVKDGLVSNPWACHFDPTGLQCNTGQDPATCLTLEQVRVVGEIYAGAHDKEGNKMVLSGPLPGSELAWQGVIATRAGERNMGATIALGSLKNLLHEKNPPEDYTLRDLKFDRDSFKDTTQLHGLYDATDPDLSVFSSAGGKLIIWHGTSDTDISALNSIAYYTAIRSVMGKGSVEQFARLYVLPAVGHCGNGEGPSHVDWLSAIMSWVETSHAPNELIAKHSRGGPGGPGPGGPGPGGPRASEPLGPAFGAPAQGGGPPPAALQESTAIIDRTRPIYPYPYVAKYIGTGSIDDAANFTKGDAQPAPAERLRWFGSGFLLPHYEQWCTGNGTSMTCKASK